LFGLTAAFALLGACERDKGADPRRAPSQVPEPAPTAAPAPPPATQPGAQAQAPLPEEPEPSGTSDDPAGDAGLPSVPEQAEEASEKPHPGPWFVVTKSETGIYADTTFDQKLKIGWARNGGKIPVHEEVTKKPNCGGGWYRLVAGGYICGNSGTTNLEHSDVRFAQKPPKIEDRLPYVYARNLANGTPLYRHVPTAEQVQFYEKGGSKRKTSESTGAAPAPSDAGASDAPTGPLLGDAGIMLVSHDAGSRPWWQRENAKDRLHEIKLDELQKDADDVIAQRLVAGFWIAVEKTFKWNGRLWYKTTRNQIAPADRFSPTSGSSFQGVEVDGTNWQLPIAWVYGYRKEAPLYTIGEDNSIKPAPAVKHFQPIALTGGTREIKNTKYLETRDGLWVKKAHVRMTLPNAPPPDVAPDERWLDINIAEQTIVVFQGTRPIYATLISSGKESKIKEKDHRTPRGEWRIREKHITSKMDGDGTAAGDLPYSIEDVPYVMYFHRAYAVHAAFWHELYGNQRSHGCVNLAPLDAKRIFYLTEPPIPEGLHGAWATKEHLGSRVVVHD
jgi:hypothetical protein